jgi:hypothetical protein
VAVSTCCSGGKVRYWVGALRTPSQARGAGSRRVAAADQVHLAPPCYGSGLPHAVPGLATHPVKRGARADAGNGVEALGFEEGIPAPQHAIHHRLLRRLAIDRPSGGQRARAATFAAILIAVSAQVILLRSMGGKSARLEITLGNSDNIVGLNR